METLDDTQLLSLLRRRFTERRADLSTMALVGGSSFDAPTPAAVLIPVVLGPDTLTVLLTRRTDHLRDHAGQISFPGGRSEPQDGSPAVTALREASEEVGLRAEQIEVLGELSPFYTGTGFVVTPVVGLVTPPLELMLDDFEVAEAFQPPLEFLLNPCNRRRRMIEVRGAPREFWAIPWRDYIIWGATAGMLVALYRFLGLTEPDTVAE